MTLFKREPKVEIKNLVYRGDDSWFGDAVVSGEHCPFTAIAFAGETMNGGKYAEVTEVYWEQEQPRISAREVKKAISGSIKSMLP